MKNSLETEKDLREFYKTGDVEIARGILKDHFAGNLEYATAAQDLVTKVAIMNKEGRLDSELAGPLLASVVVDPRDRSNPRTWRWSSDAVYALRILAENFAEYDHKRLGELKSAFNSLYSDMEYRIKDNAA